MWKPERSFKGFPGLNNFLIREQATLILVFWSHHHNLFILHNSMDTPWKDLTISTAGKCKVKEPGWTPRWGTAWVIGHSGRAGERYRKHFINFGTLYVNRLHNGEIVIEWFTDHMRPQWFPTFNYSINIYYFPTVYQSPARQSSRDQNNKTDQVPTLKELCLGFVYCRLKYVTWKSKTKNKLHTFKLFRHARHCVSASHTLI